MNRQREYRLNYLSLEFYEKYNTVDYPEIENKDNRPYVVILIKIENNTFAIPFRTNVSHDYCYRFVNSKRPTNSITGLDYTKAVIVNNDRYIGTDASIDDQEYIELRRNYRLIINKFQKFVLDYIRFANGERSYFALKKFRYTTLKYFHQELGITENSNL